MSDILDLDKMVFAMSNDGGEWRKVEFWTKSSSNEVMEALNTLNKVAHVGIYRHDVLLNQPQVSDLVARDKDTSND